MNKYKESEEITYYDKHKFLFYKTKVRLIIFEQEKISYLVEHSDRRTLVEEENVIPNKSTEEVQRLNQKIKNLMSEREERIKKIDKDIDKKFKDIFNF